MKQRLNIGCYETGIPIDGRVKNAGSSVIPTVTVTG